MKITFVDGKSIEITKNETLYEAFLRTGIYLSASCGGAGTCGKCKVRIIEGKYECKNYGKLSYKDIEKGIVLACQTYALSNLKVEILKESKLTIGDKIALSYTKKLKELFLSYNVKISPLIEKLNVELPQPTIDDNISDLQRLNRYLEEKDLKFMFQRKFLKNLSDDLRKNNWQFNLCWQKDNMEALYIEPLNSKKDYGIAIDIGTTTIVVYLVDLSNIQVIDVGSTYNSQIRYGDDVITRIIYATENGKLKDLRYAVVSDINDILDNMFRRIKIEPSAVTSAVISGNTTMTHLFWELNPAYIREEPYIPTANIFPIWKASEAGLHIHPEAPVYTIPCVASYVGGDIVSGVIATKIHRKPEISLFIDIGTNGEIVIGNNELLVTAACSAGPCFEGGGIKCGMRAIEGAIELIEIIPETFEPKLKVIGNTNPIGICGSGMISAVSEMFLKGVIDQKGKIIKNSNSNYIKEAEEGLEYLLFSSSDRDIVLTQVDIDNLIRAKGAIYAGISLLLKELGFTYEMIDKVYIAGGFGNYIDIKKAIIMGMLPDLPEDKFQFVGNTSVLGAYLCLLSEELRKEAEKVSSMMTYIELSIKSNYMDEFMSALFLPHTDTNQFPSVMSFLS